jgi:hypothetical protein
MRLKRRVYRHQKNEDIAFEFTPCPLTSPHDFAPYLYDHHHTSQRRLQNNNLTPWWNQPATDRGSLSRI